ncbi:hypothetical protein ACOMHN_010340 [Nucella lapillus]
MEVPIEHGGHLPGAVKYSTTAQDHQCCEVTVFMTETMAWTHSIVIFAALLLATVGGQGQPAIVTDSGQTWTSYVGGIVSMSCQVQNLGTHKLNWVFVKDSTTISHGDQLLVQDDRYILMHPPDSNVFSLQIMFAREDDQGVYRCEIEGTTQAITMQLVLEGERNAVREGVYRCEIEGTKQAITMQLVLEGERNAVREGVYRCEIEGTKQAITMQLVLEGERNAVREGVYRCEIEGTKQAITMQLVLEGERNAVREGVYRCEIEGTKQAITMQLVLEGERNAVREGVYRCEIEGTKQAITMQLVLEGEKNAVREGVYRCEIEGTKQAITMQLVLEGERNAVREGVYRCEIEGTKQAITMQLVLEGERNAVREGVYRCEIEGTKQAITMQLVLEGERNAVREGVYRCEIEGTKQAITMQLVLEGERNAVREGVYRCEIEGTKQAITMQLVLEGERNAVREGVYRCEIEGTKQAITMQLVLEGERNAVREGVYRCEIEGTTQAITMQLVLEGERNAVREGVYRCEIEGTTQAITMQLVLEGAPDIPDVNTTSSLNRTSCCQERGVSRQCASVCNPPTSGAAVAIATCTDYLDDFLYCGSGGRNHEDCCARSDVPAGCLSFCSNNRDKMPHITIDQYHCVLHIDAIISCFEYGGRLLPSPPQSLSVMSVSRNGSYSLQVSWRPPRYNPSSVSGYRVHYKKAGDAKFMAPPRYNPSSISGYRVHYKKAGDAKFMATGVLNAATNTYALSAQVNTRYTVYVTAKAQHGASQPTDRVEIVVQDTSSPGQATDVLACCQGRSVPAKCQATLCHPRVWAHFNVTDLIECYPYLTDVVTCLNGEVDHSGCCSSNNVPGVCVGLCSSHPPPFNRSLAACVPKLSIIEACIQTGLADQPRPPRGLTLVDVGAHHALISWTRPPNATNATHVNAYYVQLRRGAENAVWETVAQVVGTFVDLRKLTETETYSVRVIASTARSSSLPSAMLWFTTYPEITPDGRPTVAHNISQCCVDSGMPGVCSAGCRYQANMTAYYEGVLLTCLDHIGTVLTCAADGRDHTSCCRQRGVQELCYDLCSHTTPGALDLKYLACLNDTASIVQCYREGLEDLVGMPKDLEVTNETSHTISLQWNNPLSGPTPQHYQVTYVDLLSDVRKQESTEGLTYILQNLAPETMYDITVASVLNDTTSPPTYPITASTPRQGSGSPFFPNPPTNSSRALWTSRSHCCHSSNISEACRGVCMNRPATNATDCSPENHNILICAADGQDHSMCCEENGLPQECLPLCGSYDSKEFSVRLAGCLADARLSIITSCFLDNSGLLPSTPFEFRARTIEGTEVVLEWSRASNCDPSVDPCSYDVHYWPSHYTDPSRYTTVLNGTSPFSLKDLRPNQHYTFTVTARNSKGSGAPAPWITLFLSGQSPDVSIGQTPKRQVFQQGTNVYLTCNAFNLQGAPRFTWRFRGRTLPTSGRVLRLVRVSERSEGNYNCTVTSGSESASAESYVNIRFKPSFAYFRTDTVRPNVGAEAVLACWFRGHPNTDSPAAIWTKGSQPIAPSSRLSFTVKSRYHTGITAFKLKIALVVPSDYGRYQCNVSNSYGYKVAHTNLIDPAKMPPPIQPTPAQKRNVSNCCQARGVVDTCIPLCSMQVSTEEAIQNPNKYGVCLMFFSEMIECAADGADHSLCCEGQAVPEVCLPFCKGRVPPITSLYSSPQLIQCVPETPSILDCMERGYGETGWGVVWCGVVWCGVECGHQPVQCPSADASPPQLMQCVPETPSILDCMERGYEKIPTAPRNLVVSMVLNKIKISWEPPARNADRVTSYHIYYNFTGNPVYQIETVTNFVGFKHELNNVDESHMYQIWMTAEAYNFGQSQSSKRVTVSTNGQLPSAPSRVRVDSLQGTTVVVSWVPPTSGTVRAEAYAVYYMPTASHTPTKKKTMETRITLRGLEPFTRYKVYVASRVRAGEGIASLPVIFTTGEESGPGTGEQTGGSLSEGQIGGVVLAVVIVIAVTILLAVLLYRSRVGKTRQTESVSFQNPAYGNQQVHIGDLPPNNPYDNALEPQTQPEKDGDFSYARLQEDRAPAEASAQPVSEVDTAYSTPADPCGVSLDVADSNGVANVPGADLNNESTT